MPYNKSYMVRSIFSSESRLSGPPEESRLSSASDTCHKTTPLNYHIYSPRIWCHSSELHGGPGGMSRAPGPAAPLPPALLGGEADAPAAGAALQLAGGPGRLPP